MTTDKRGENYTKETNEDTLNVHENETKRKITECLIKL